MLRMFITLTIPDHGQIDAVDGHVVSGHALAGRFPAAVDRDRAGNVAHGNSVAVLLHFHFLQVKKS